MMKKRLLATGDGYSDQQLRSLRDAGYEVTHLPGEPSRKTLLECLSQAHVHILGGPETLSAEDISQAPHLEFICFVGTGYGAFIDEMAAKARGIGIGNTPGLMTNCVAEYTVGMLLAASRRIRSHDQSSSVYSGSVRDFSDRRVGILGLGAIGERVARILFQGFGQAVSYHSRTRKPFLEQELKLTYLDLDQLFEACDTVVVLLPTSAQTKGIVDTRRLRLMPRQSLLVNTAGAWLVEPSALRDALESNHLEMAAFDGYYVEPLPHIDDDAFGLLGLGGDKFFVTPHIAAKTAGAWPKMIGAAVQAVVSRAAIAS